MRKNKILLPIAAIGAMAIAITPLSALTSCNEKKEVINKVIPIDAYVIDKDGVLRGFKKDFKLSPDYDTMAFGFNEDEPAITKIGPAAFYNPRTNASTIPDQIKYLKFAETKSKEHLDVIILGPLSEIGEYAFYGSPFEQVELPLGLRRIKRFAFSHSKVESCYFPPWLNIIDEEAFSYSNLYAASFNNQLSQFYEIDTQFYRVPWMRMEMNDPIKESCVNHVGKKAFYNCKNLIMHRPPSICNDKTYELDEEGYGPFAIYDELSHKTVNSNIRVLDYRYVLKNIIPCPEPKKTFNVVVNDPSAKQIDKFIILDDHFLLVNNEGPQLDIVNNIFDSFGVKRETTLKPFPARMGDWTTIRASQAGYIFGPDYTNLNYPIQTTLEGNEVSLLLPYFGEGAEEQTFNNFFPEDTHVTINNVLDTQQNAISLPNTTLNVVYNENEKHYFLKIEINDKLTNLDDYLDFDITIWSKFGFSYRYGYQYVHVGSGEYATELRNPISVRIR